MPLPTDTYYKHPQSLVETENIGKGTTIWAFVHVLPGATIGEHCNICDHCFIEGGVIIGNEATVKTGVSIWDGVVLQDKVFVGPNAVFTNDLLPRSKNAAYLMQATLVKTGASIGANATVLSGITIGRYALIGIGSVVTHDVPDYALVYGNPARQHGWVDERGEKLTADGAGQWRSTDGTLYAEVENGLIMSDGQDKQQSDS